MKITVAKKTYDIPQANRAYALYKGGKQRRMIELTCPLCGKTNTVEAYRIRTSIERHKMPVDLVGCHKWCLGGHIRRINRAEVAAVGKSYHPYVSPEVFYVNWQIISEALSFRRMFMVDDFMGQPPEMVPENTPQTHED